MSEAAFPALEPELRDRLALDAAGFEAFLAAFLGAVPERPCGPDEIELALSYPWARPAASYVLREGEVHDADPGLAAGRHPILAFGSNAAPTALERKFAHFEDPRDRQVLVVAGDLLDFDVAPAASVAAYGAMPATLLPSPGTAVRAAVVFATDAQAVQLTWSELTYAFGRLDVAFESPELSVRSVLAYANRCGAFAPRGERLALAAVPARDRTAAPRTQRELLDEVARLTLGDTARAEDVVRAVYAGGGRFYERVRERIWPLGVPFAATGWRPYAAA